MALPTQNKLFLGQPRASLPIYLQSRTDLKQRKQGKLAKA